MSVQIQLRRGTAAQWASANPVLADGEPAIETDTRVYKIGDGVTPWRDLPSVSKADAEAMIDDLEVRLTGTFATKEDLSEVGTGDPIAVTDASMAAVVDNPATATGSMLFGRFVTWVTSEEEADALPPGTLALILEPAGEQYVTDFSEYTTGQQPSDWSLAWRRGFVSWRVVDDAAATGGKLLRITVVVTNSEFFRHGLAWDKINADPDRDDVEILYRMRASSAMAARALGRGGNPGEWVTPVGYAAGPSEGNLVISQLTPNATLYTTPRPLTAGTWYWTRARMEGGLMRVRTWQDGTTEPTTWTEVTGTGTGDPGWVGLMADRPLTAGATVDVDVFAVATGGKTAEVS